MHKTGIGLTTHFASPERDTRETIEKLVMQLREEPTLGWFNALPMSMAIINEHRQIIHCNTEFKDLAQKEDVMDIIGLRPGEALNCINARAVKAGCGCSNFCNVCGAAQAIIKSLNGHADCQECRLVRLENGTEVPLDLQVFTQPMQFNGHPLILVFIMDISHELRLRYLNRTFHHSLINGVGGIATLTEIIESDPVDSDLFPLLIESSQRTLRDVLYHRDVEAAEHNRLTAKMETIEAEPYFKQIAMDECIQRNTQDSCVDISVTTKTIISDKRLLGHVVHNMLSNALEAWHEKTGTITLSCSDSTDGRTVITVTNPGVIPENIQKQMFKRYVSTKSRDRGLGTYVMKLLTTGYLGGEIAFTSENNVTSFTVTLPAASAERSA
ncbi:sensor histidine kinase [Pseudodesulfovibrio sediminis]|uniref:Sensor histidine kinase n=1 Tax=Pseudodesulfovibrio sediminis TaxID=2810563 RepID=A0ABN6ET69_9BACT|nr:sensor histidine kinase [Pseudodesulfovibrio sediminis]BCS88256.1 sensor histidine kinase [Pseudodesulfovibrio sediminis]